MPRRIEDILAHADDLAAEFEVFDPAGTLPLTAEEWRIVEATAAHAAAERALRDAVVAARAADVSGAPSPASSASATRPPTAATPSGPARTTLRLTPTCPLRALLSASSRQPSVPDDGQGNRQGGQASEGLRRRQSHQGDPGPQRLTPAPTVARTARGQLRRFRFVVGASAPSSPSWDGSCAEPEWSWSAFRARHPIRRCGRGRRRHRAS